MKFDFVCVSLPPGPVGVRLTVYEPAANTWLRLVKIVFVVAPSPKFQKRLVIVPVELSVKLTNKGAVPPVGVALKAAIGWDWIMVVINVAALFAPFGSAVRDEAAIALVTVPD